MLLFLIHGTSHLMADLSFLMAIDEEFHVLGLFPLRFKVCCNLQDLLHCGFLLSVDRPELIAAFGHEFVCLLLHCFS